MVDSRWAMTIDVRPARASASACWIRASFSESRWEVASSRIDDRRVLQQQPGDGQPLLLAAREAVAPLADHGVVAVGQGGDDVVDAGRPAGGDDLVVGGVGPGVAQVGGDRVVEQVRVLAHDADGAAQAVQRQVAHVVAVDAHGARR